MPKSPTRPTQYPSPQWARELQRGKPRHSCRGGRPGLRASEVSLLQRDDVHAKQGRIYIPCVKGSIAKTYPLQPEDLRLVRAYLRTREDDSPFLFISSR